MFSLLFETSKTAICHGGVYQSLCNACIFFSMANAIPSLGDQKNETVLKNEIQVVLSVKISQLANREL